MTLLNSSVRKCTIGISKMFSKTNYLQERLDTVESRITTFETIFDGFREIS